MFQRGKKFERKNLQQTFSENSPVSLPFFPQVDKKSASAHDSKASLLSPPDPGFAVYMALNICVWIGLWFAVTKQHGMEELNPHYMAFLVSVGPLVLAQVAGDVKANLVPF